MFDNHVIFDPTGGMNYHDCDEWAAHDNILYGPNVTLPCKKRGMKPYYTLAEWQQLDPKTHDVGSKVVSETPSAEQIIVLAKALLA
jgi:hypothetical protein